LPSGLVSNNDIISALKESSSMTVASFAVIAKVVYCYGRWRPRKQIQRKQDLMHFPSMKYTL